MTTWIDQQPAAKVESSLAVYRAANDPTTKAAKDYCGGDERFGLWLLLCSLVCARKTGVTIFDLEDFMWRDEYEAGASPKSATRSALAASEVFG